jgi:molecular chaperone DnaK
MDPGDKTKLENGIESIKSAMKTDNADQIKNATENLNKTWQAVGQKMYQSASAQQGGAESAQSSAGGSAGQASEAKGPQEGEKVVDADYEILDDEKK